MSHGTETQKALNNFGTGSTPQELIRAYALVKQAALSARQEVNPTFTQDEFQALMDVCQEIRDGLHKGRFPLPLHQGGAGTSLNMNMNEVVALLAEEKLKARGILRIFHPIEDINAYQSTNDTFATAVTLAAYEQLVSLELLVIKMQETLVAWERRSTGKLLVGRTELQDALPMTLDLVFASWAGLFERDRWRLSKLKERIRTIALGGTAVGTTFSAPRAYIFAAEKHLRRLCGLPLTRSQNFPDEISNQDKFSELAGGYRLVAENIFKMSGDLLFYTSAAVAEMQHPNLQSGSTIMAAKTNPVILEFARGLAMDVQGEALKVSLFVQNGQLQLNAYLPFIAASLFTMFTQLEKALTALIERFFPALEVAFPIMEKHLSSSPALLNALLPVLGYEKIKSLLPHLEKTPLYSLEDMKKLLAQNTELTNDQLDELLDSRNLTTSRHD